MAAAITMLAPPSQAGAHWEPAVGRGWMTRLAVCETGNNITHETRSYVSAWGFYRRTWDLFADTPAARADRLTWDQQARVVDRAFWFGWVKPDGSKQWPVGPFGHGCWKSFWEKYPDLRHTVCYHAKKQVRRWCRPTKGNNATKENLLKDHRVQSD